MVHRAFGSAFARAAATPPAATISASANRNPLSPLSTCRYSCTHPVGDYPGSALDDRRPEDLTAQSRSEVVNLVSRGGAHRIGDLLEPAGCDDREQSTLRLRDVPPTVWRIAWGDDVRARATLKDFVSERDSVSSGDHEEVFVRIAM